MSQELTEEQKNWVKLGYEREYTEGDLINMLKKHGYNEEKIKSMIKYYWELGRQKDEQDMIKGIEEGKTIEEAFKKEVMGEELTRKEKKELKNYRKTMNKYLKALKQTSENIKKTKTKLKISLGEAKARKSEEWKKIDEEIRENLLFAKTAISIQDIYTGQEITEQSVKQWTSEELEKQLEMNIMELDMFVNGKYTPRDLNEITKKEDK